MKTSIIEKRLNENTKNIRNTINELVLLTPANKGDSLKEVIDQLPIDYIESARRLKFPAQTAVGKFAGLDIKENQTPRSILEAYLYLFHQRCPNGNSFTPRLSVSEHEGVGGYNCFSKAMLFASFARYHKIRTGIAFSVDHTMCVCYDGEDRYLCDPTNGTIQKMHGEFTTTNNTFDWYRKNKTKDDFIYNRLVVTTVGFGGLYNICKSFDFLKKTPWDHTVNRVLPEYDYTGDMFEVMNPKLPYRKIISSIDWDNLIQKVFFPLEEYKKIYEDEWTLEVELTRLYRERMIVHSKFDRALASAICATDFTGNPKDFFKQYLPIMTPRHEEVFNYLRTGVAMTSKMSKNVETFLKLLRISLQKDENLKEYGLKKMEEKMIKQLIGHTE